MPTSPREAYELGVKARIEHPEAIGNLGEQLELCPFAPPSLVQPWLDGFHDDPTAYNRCPHCWTYGMTDLPDGKTRCKNMICWNRNYPPVDREAARIFLAKHVNMGSFI